MSVVYAEYLHIFLNVQLSGGGGRGLTYLNLITNSVAFRNSMIMDGHKLISVSGKAISIDTNFKGGNEFLSISRNYFNYA